MVRKFLTIFWILLVPVCGQLFDLPCDKTDCNGKGSCLGTKSAPMCFCELGYSGLRCEQSQCDSKIACNGNGICIGSSLQNSCVCNLGYTGLRCENSPNSGNNLFGLLDLFGSGISPMSSNSLFGNNALGSLNNLFKSLPSAFIPQGQSLLPNASLTSRAVIEPLVPPPEEDNSNANIFPSFQPANDAMFLGNANGSDLKPLHALPLSLPIVAANYSLPMTQGLDVCGPQDCNNQGICIGSRTLPVCLCYVGFTGVKCETNVFDNLNIGDSGHSIICSASDCNNNGVCIGTKASFTCACKLGYSGRRCESTPFPLCDASDCNNNGLCIGTKGSFTCACHLGFSGSRCEKAQGTLCEIADCNTQGICLGTKDQFTCLCNLGYSGKRCETRVLDTVAPLAGGLFCELKDCSNNGLCIGTKLLPTCLCNLGYLGLRCEIEPLCFSPLQCSGNGLCLGTAKNFICACNLGWSGPNCQYFSG